MNHSHRVNRPRRDFLQISSAIGAFGVLGVPELSWGAPNDAWDEGQLKHVIPAANHDRFLIKTSFKAALAFTPRLTVNGTAVEGFRTDLAGRFWRFDVKSLTPATQYELQLTDPDRKPLCDPWPLKTF